MNTLHPSNTKKFHNRSCLLQLGSVQRKLLAQSRKLPQFYFYTEMQLFSPDLTAVV